MSISVSPQPSSSTLAEAVAAATAAVAVTSSSAPTASSDSRRSVLSRQPGGNIDRQRRREVFRTTVPNQQVAIQLWEQILTLLTNQELARRSASDRAEAVVSSVSNTLANYPSQQETSASAIIRSDSSTAEIATHISQTAAIARRLIDLTTSSSQSSAPTSAQPTVTTINGNTISSGSFSANVNSSSTSNSSLRL